jgi:hypothetical protein
MLASVSQRWHLTCRQSRGERLQIIAGLRNFVVSQKSRPNWFGSRSTLLCRGAFWPVHRSPARRPLGQLVGPPCSCFVPAFNAQVADFTIFMVRVLEWAGKDRHSVDGPATGTGIFTSIAGSHARSGGLRGHKREYAPFGPFRKTVCIWRGMHGRGSRGRYLPSPNPPPGHDDPRLLGDRLHGISTEAERVGAPPIRATKRPPSGGLFVCPWTTTRNDILFLQVELKAQSVGYSLNAPLKADRVAGRRDDDRLPTVSMISANADMYIAYAERSDDHLR